MLLMLRRSGLLIARHLCPRSTIQQHRTLHSSVRLYQRPLSMASDAQASSPNTSGVTSESMKVTLTEKLEAELVEIQDESGVQANIPHGLGYPRL